MNMGSMKGILWGIAFLLSALFYFAIPTKIIVTYWVDLATLTDVEGKPVYTYAIFFVFVWILTLLIGLIYLTAMMRSFIQRKNEDLGVPRAVKGFGLVSVIIWTALYVLWYVFFNSILFFS